MYKLVIPLILLVFFVSCGKQEQPVAEKAAPKSSEWIALFNGENLDGWFVRGKATWEVKDGILIGDGGMGHIYTNVVAEDFKIKGTFRVSENGNSGLYFRCNPPEDNPDGWPKGYEAQIDNHQDAHTGWLWKPGSPTQKAKALITKDNEWFTMMVKMVGSQLQIWVNDELMTEYDDGDYTKGHFAIQGHNPGMTIEVKELLYKVMSVK